MLAKWNRNNCAFMLRNEFLTWLQRIMLQILIDN
jgi:hypothetical protein